MKKNDEFGMIENWKHTPEVFSRNPEDCTVKTCIEGNDESEDPITFQEYVGMLKDVVNAIEAGEDFNRIKIVYGKADWDKIRRKTLEFENSKDDGNYTLTVEDAMIRRDFTALDILKVLLAYLRVE